MKKRLALFTLLASVSLLAGCGGQPQEDTQDTLTGSMIRVSEPAAGNNCAAACENYVRKCLTLVPGAGETLFQQGRDSCMEECAQWTDKKTDCIATAAGCEPMTDVCGL
ncbi:MAG: hypothetical protein PHS73_01655 [Candidatus Peribacteraceae bacterium]|nr:hypothetical protein [Candidatus Peribacteraceae bacterium]